ncbi:hypothetical protein ACR6C2_25585 [Streptomyces sp. INA 01156]
MVIDTLFFLALAAAHWHAQRQHAQQAAAARQAATHLQVAYAAASEEPMARLRAQGLRLPQPVRDWSATLLCTTAPQIAERVLGEPGWPALAATITHAYQAGHDPQALLHEAVTQRELHTAGSASDVLVWRLRRMADLPANVTVISPHSTRATDSLPYAAHSDPSPSLSTSTADTAGNHQQRRGRSVC